MLLAGLLVSGVLKGQEIISQTRSKQIVSDLNSLQAAVHVYRDRYRALPGDDWDAQGRWTTLGAKSGDNDGIISGKYQDRLTPGALPSSLTVDPTTGESQNFWWHLRLSGFVLGPQSGVGAADLPVHAAGGVIGVQTGESTVAGFLPSLMACVSNVSGRTAIAIDSDLDDLSPSTGRVRALLQPAGSDTPPLASAQTIPNYIEDGTSRYVVCRGLD